MKKLKNIIGLFAAMLVFFSCQKQGLMPYELGAGVGLYKPDIVEGSDSMLRSFAVLNDTVQHDTITLPLRIAGDVSSVDRTVNFGIIDSVTTAKPASYQLLSASIPAGSYVGSLSVQVNKTADLKTTDARLWIQILPSADFSFVPDEGKNYLIKFNNYLSKPASWDEIRFGDYSQVKYALIIKETGYIDFAGLHPEVLIFIVGKCRNALEEYLDEHGTEMLDENNVPVRFP